MRLCSSLSVCLAAAAVCVPASAAGASAATGATSCVGSDTRAFPLGARIRGGPKVYEAGGGYGTWYIDLTNGTHQACAAIHPVVVLADDKHTLKPDQPKLDFYDGSRPRPVTFESTDEQELVGVLDGSGFGGFTVPAGKTVSVKVRLMLTSDAAADQVTVNAAVVQRRGGDGDWVGESNAYRFGIGVEPDDRTVPPPASPNPNPRDTRNADGGDETAPPTGPSTGPSGSPSVGPSGAPSTGPRPTASGTAGPDPALPVAEEAEAAGERARELARTGPQLAHGLLAAAAAVLAVGGAAFLLARRRR
ncbi:hypothetical protein AB0N17_06890 [Streptomyces sp. NPDC051133]|uniref:hypothetical protein n=1 Tax=Streptomyces sp. NPDC051133 TaxID=3155521 RepID=UPI00342274CA